MQISAFGAVLATPSLKESGSHWSKWEGATQKGLWSWRDSDSWGRKAAEEKTTSVFLSYYFLPAIG